MTLMLCFQVKTEARSQESSSDVEAAIITNLKLKTNQLFYLMKLCRSCMNQSLTAMDISILIRMGFLEVLFISLLKFLFE